MINHTRNFTPSVFYIGQVFAVGSFNSYSALAVIPFITVFAIYFIYSGLSENVTFCVWFIKTLFKVFINNTEISERLFKTLSVEIGKRGQRWKSIVTFLAYSFMRKFETGIKKELHYFPNLRCVDDLFAIFNKKSLIPTTSCHCLIIDFLSYN